VLDWLELALKAIDPEVLTRQALASAGIRRLAAIAIGKAAPEMMRGAAAAGLIGGVCVSDHVATVPTNVNLIIGDHPIPGEASHAAAHAVQSFAETAPTTHPLIGLISGGGSSLCEAPRPGVSLEYLDQVTRTFIHGGANIEEINLVRGHLSSVKFGGIARAAGRPIDTFVLSDVAGADPGVIASGPTIPREPDPARARAVMEGYDIAVPPSVWQAMSYEYKSLPAPQVTLLADGRDAGAALARASGLEAELWPRWLQGEINTCLDWFLQPAGAGLSIAVGEPVIEVGVVGRGGRNTHAALLAATRLAGTNDLFVAFATDGVDGQSESAGAIVDGSTVTRGGNPDRALAQFDSASYLETTGDLLICEPTGTNVSDIWILWRRTRTQNVE
jgi:hydroxypyruvate reductase